jgi:hypothetical protein
MKPICVDLEHCDFEQYCAIVWKLVKLDRGVVKELCSYESYFMYDYIGVDIDGIITHNNFVESYNRIDPLDVEVYDTPEDFWAAYGEGQMNTLQFGDKLHIAGVPYVVIFERNGEVKTVDCEGRIEKCPKERFDEFKPNPVEKRAEMLLSCWKKQALSFAHDDLNTEVVLDEMLRFMENNKDEIISILSQ